jgi:hypothetical protein
MYHRIPFCIHFRGLGGSFLSKRSESLYPGYLVYKYNKGLKVTTNYFPTKEYALSYKVVETKATAK